MANITSIEAIDNTLSNLKLLAVKLDKDIASTIGYIGDYLIHHYEEVEEHKLINWSSTDEINDDDYNKIIDYLIHELQQVEEYELNRHDVELGDNGEW